MARKYLGDAFDIHGGGVDLRFPHHENEQAQSRAAGLPFTSMWMHNAWVTTSGEKMSKSLGNSLLVHEVTKKARPLAVRYYLTAAHYRSMIEFHEGSLAEAEAAVDRIEGFLRRALGPDGAVAPTGDEKLPARFRRGHGRRPRRVRRPRRRPRHRDARATPPSTTVRTTRLASSPALVIAMTDILGVNPLDPAWSGDGQLVQRRPRRPSTRSWASDCRPGPRPVRRATMQHPTPSATSSSRPASRSRTLRPAPAGR